jgi:hypothetical protein
MFTKRFEKIAGKESLTKAIKSVSVDPVVKRVGSYLGGSPGGYQSSSFGKALIGKSGNKLTPEYMKKTYGIDWKG